MPAEDEHNHTDEFWRSYLLTGEVEGAYPVKMETLRNFLRLLPSDPRCNLCKTPFAGVGGAFSRVLLNRRRSTLNPLLCDVCERFARDNRGGAEVEISMLFADIRGSTTIAERISAAEFSSLINRFYRATTDILVHANALIEKLIGDEVAGLFVPGIAGSDHARAAIDAAQEILRATGHGADTQPWAPLGVGVHTGIAYVGAVGTAEGMGTISALGDAVNTASRLASQAKTGEIVVSEDAAIASELDLTQFEAHRLQLKGRSEPIDVRIIPLNSAG